MTNRVKPLSQATKGTSVFPRDGWSMGGCFRSRPLMALTYYSAYLFRGAKLSLFMLVSALMGLDLMKEAYAHAIENGYRFYSYGDSSLLLPL